MGNFSRAPIIPGPPRLERVSSVPTDVHVRPVNGSDRVRRNAAETLKKWRNNLSKNGSSWFTR